MNSVLGKKAALLSSLFMFLLAEVHAIPAMPITWMSSSGNDANPGTRASPKRTLQGAIDADSRNTIIALDQENYGQATIPHAYIVDGTGTSLQLIFPVPGSTVTVAAGPDDTVILRNIEFSGAGGGDVGVLFTSGKELVIENCKFSGYLVSGVSVELAAAGKLVMNNCSITGGVNGVAVTGVGSPIQVTLNNVSIQNTTTAVNAFAGFVELANSAITQNDVGVSATITSQVSCFNSFFTQNGKAIAPGVGATVRISNNDFYNNDTVLGFEGGDVATANNNRFSGNGSSSQPNLSIVYQ